MSDSYLLRSDKPTWWAHICEFGYARDCGCLQVLREQEFLLAALQALVSEYFDNNWVNFEDRKDHEAQVLKYIRDMELLLGITGADRFLSNAEDHDDTVGDEQ